MIENLKETWMINAQKSIMFGDSTSDYKAAKKVILNLNILNEKKYVVIMGGAGFVGSNLIKKLLKEKKNFNSKFRQLFFRKEKTMLKTQE